MKQFLLITAGLCMPLLISAESTRNPVPIQINRKGNSSGNSGILRSPIRINIQAYIEPSTGELEIQSKDTTEGEIFIFDNNGMEVGYSPFINTIIYLPITHSEDYYIYIYGDSWTASGEIHF